MNYDAVVRFETEGERGYIMGDLIRAAVIMRSHADPPR